MTDEEVKDLRLLITAINLAQSRGAFRLDHSEALYNNVKNVTEYINRHTSS